MRLDRLVLPEGFRIGHWTDADALTGCTVVLCPPGTVGSCDVRGGSPGSRELSLLSPEKSMQEVHAVLLTGGSAFGLAAADGVVRYLEERGIGYETPWARVPIVPAAVVYDLNIGSATVRPGPEAGYKACTAARAGDVAEGNVGAGTGATVGKWAGAGPGTRMKGGFGLAAVHMGDIVVCAAAVVNAVGDIVDPTGRVLAGARAEDGRWLADVDPYAMVTGGIPLQHANTTLVVLHTNAALTKVDVYRFAQRGHDGMARAVRPVHTSYDGDLVFALASKQAGPAPVDVVAEMGAEATALAIRRAVQTAASAGGVPGLAGGSGNAGEPVPTP